MKKLLCFDLDGTLTPASTWWNFNLAMGITPEEDKRLFDEYLSGKLTYKAWIAELVRIYHSKNKLISKSAVIALVETLPIIDGALELIANVKEKGYEIILISGSTDTIVETFAKRLGITAWRASTSCIYNDQEEIIDLVSIGDERQAKLGLLSAFCTENDFELSETIAVGDGGNDLDIFKLAKGICVGNNKDLVPVAWKQVATLSEIKYLI